MAHLFRSVATLRIAGDTLVPDEITALLGCQPTTSHSKGDIVRGPNTGRDIIRRTGLWRLKAADCEPENLDAQVAEILSALPQDLELWEKLRSRFSIDLFCGFFMEDSNEGVGVSSETLLLLGQRGIELSLDIYGPSKSLQEKGPCPCGSGKAYGECCAIETGGQTAI